MRLTFLHWSKSAEHNLELIARLGSLVELGRPVAIGVSRKSFIGRLLDVPAGERLEGGLAAAAVAVFLGARIVRTHDVRPTIRATRMAAILRESGRFHYFQHMITVVAKAKGYGLAMPLTERLIAMIEELETGRRQMAWANLDELVRSA